MRIPTFAASVAALAFAAVLMAPAEAGARGGFAKFGGAGAFKGGALHHGLRFRHGWRRLGYGVIVSGPGAVIADNPPLYLNVNNQLPREAQRPLQRVCHVRVHTVPSEAGGLRDVTVTRCFFE
jgi:hypothetical protein